MSEENKTLYRTIHPEVKVIDEKKGIVEYVASDETLDSHREIVLVNGWRFTNFRKNAPFLNSHGKWSIDDLLGKVLSANVVNNQLIEKVQWAIDVPENEMARLGFNMTVKGYLKGVSVGFMPVESVWRSNDASWSEALKEHNISVADAAVLRRLFVKQEQLELSSVVIGSNPNALLRAFEDGAVKEEQLKACGFGGDDEFDFLQKAAAAIESPECDAAFKAMLDLNMKRIYTNRGNSNKKEFQPSGTAATERANAAEVEKLAAEQREDFLTKLNSLTKG
eukprot:Seg11976.4 transcript_id=Seg11976.4/GoldUCD/mRNA.D3Y31 product="hypothetical protein" protein_id=Seg11976.4/GoldUCD/D3Y31